jgi:hypothetical protein
MTFASLSTQVGAFGIGVKRAHGYPTVAVPPPDRNDACS